MKTKLGQKIYLPKQNKIVTVIEIDKFGNPSKAIDKDKIIDIVGEVWELVTIIKKLLSFVKSIFK